MDLVQGVLQGDRLSVSRAISLIERQDAEDRLLAQELLARLYPHTGKAHLVGVTGAPGTGKSSLVNRLAVAYRGQEERVGVVAVDPTSPFSGGALLGDRIRMGDLSGDPGVFVRSMATRGALGGLAQSTYDAVQVLDAAGYGIILIETVGAGQDEVAIARTAHTVLVVQAPGLGDDIQAIKAGLMEIADVFVVNKADREGTDQAVRALEMMLGLAGEGGATLGGSDSRVGRWAVPVCRTVALDGTGVPELVAQIERHRAYLLHSGLLRQREVQRAGTALEDRLRRRLFSDFLSAVDPARWEGLVERIATRHLSPQEATEELLESIPHAQPGGGMDGP